MCVSLHLQQDSLHSLNYARQKSMDPGRDYSVYKSVNLSLTHYFASNSEIQLYSAFNSITRSTLLYFQLNWLVWLVP